MDTRRKSEKPYDNVAAKLRKLRTKRENIAREYDRVLTKRLVDYISELSERYTLYVALGKLKHIRNKARRDSRKSREFRKMIHSWAFSRITNSLKYQLLQLGWLMGELHVSVWSQRHGHQFFVGNVVPRGEDPNRVTSIVPHAAIKPTRIGTEQSTSLDALLRSQSHCTL